MDKSSDKQQSVRRFQCPHCEEKPFTTKANMLRHITRKHKDVFETEAGINNDNPPIETPTIDMLDEYLETVPSCIEPEPLPTDEYLIYLRNEYKKYEYLYRGLDNRIKWENANANVDLAFHLRRHNTKMTYLLVDIRDALLPIN
jgi:hypothetical protein